MVPVSISTASSPTTAVNRFVLRDKETSVTLENVKPDEWVKVICSLVNVNWHIVFVKD